MVGTGPDVDEDQRPEVDDRETVGIDRPARRFGQEIIHDAQNRRGQEERHRVMAVPPLDEAVLETGEDRIGMIPRGGKGKVVHDVEHRHRQNAGHVEPQGHVEARFVAFRESPEEVQREHHPDEHDRDVDRPDQLGVFLAAGEAAWQGDGGGHDDELPAPEMDAGEQIAGEAHLAEPLGGVVDPREHHVAHEGENHRVGMQRAQAAEGQVGNAVGLERAAGEFLH